MARRLAIACAVLVAVALGVIGLASGAPRLQVGVTDDAWLMFGLKHLIVDNQSNGYDSEKTFELLEELFDDELANSGDATLSGASVHSAYFNDPRVWAADPGGRIGFSPGHGSKFQINIEAPDIAKEMTAYEADSMSRGIGIFNVKFDFVRDAAVGLVESNNIYAPLKLDAGRNVALYHPDASKVVLSGLVWEENRKQIAGKAFLMHQNLGRGNVVAFAEDPNYRAFCDGLYLFFLNGVLLGNGR